MADIQIQFLAFQGCPHAGAARLALRQALAECEIGDYEEIDILDPSVPAGRRNWGSPTILVNGDDLSGRLKGDGVGCRIYPGADGVPNPASIVACIEEARARGALRRWGRKSRFRPCVTIAKASLSSFGGETSGTGMPLADSWKM